MALKDQPSSFKPKPKNFGKAEQQTVDSILNRYNLSGLKLKNRPSSFSTAISSTGGSGASPEPTPTPTLGAFSNAFSNAFNV